MKFRAKKEDNPVQPEQTPGTGESQQPAEPQTDSTKPAEGAGGATATAVPPQQPPQLHPAEERFIRLRADFENQRKRFERERQDMATLSNERLIRELLPVLDNFELALESAAQHKTEKAVQDGFKLVFDQLSAAVASFGLKPIDGHGKPFDPNFHEAIAHQPSDTVPEQVVVLQTRRGYQLGDRLLRPAHVIVSRGPQQTPPETAKE